MAAGPTFEPLATTTLSSAAASITFSSISSAYTDICVAFTYLKNSTGNAYPSLQFNNDTGTNYSYTKITGDGTSASSSRDTNVNYFPLDFSVGASTIIPGFIFINIFSYSGSTNKTILCNISQDKNGSGITSDLVGLWRSTSAISSIKLNEGGGGSFAAGTTVTLWGIKNA